MAKKSTGKKRGRPAKSKAVKAAPKKRGRPAKAKEESAEQPEKKKRGRPKKETAPEVTAPVFTEEIPTVSPESTVAVASEPAVAETPAVDHTKPTEEMISVGNMLKKIISNHRFPLMRAQIEELLNRSSQALRVLPVYEGNGYYITISNGVSSIRIPKSGTYQMVG